MAGTRADMTEPAKRKNTRRRILLVAVKIIIAAVLLYLLLRGTQRSDFRNAFDAIRWPWFALAVFLHFPGYLISAWRWRLLLVAQGQRIPLWRLFESYIVATFFNYALLGTLGGDAIRLSDTGLGQKRGAQAASSILVERLTGLAAMLFLATLGMVLLALTGKSSSGIGAVACGALALFALFLVALMVLTHPRVTRWAADLVGKLVPFAGRLGHKLADALEVFRADRRPVYANLAWALLLQVNVAAHYFCLALAMGLPAVREAPLQYVFGYMVLVPLITLILMIPITPGGAGLRELTLKELRGGLGIPATAAGVEQAYVLGWLQVASVLVYGAAGAVIFIARSLRKKR